MIEVIIFYAILYATLLIVGVLAYLVPDSWSKKKPDKKKNILDNPKCYDI